MEHRWDYVLIAACNCWSWKDGERNRRWCFVAERWWLKPEALGSIPGSTAFLSFPLPFQRSSDSNGPDLIRWSPLVFGLWGSPVHQTPHAVIKLTILSWSLMEQLHDSLPNAINSRLALLIHFAQVPTMTHHLSTLWATPAMEAALSLTVLTP